MLTQSNLAMNSFIAFLCIGLAAFVSAEKQCEESHSCKLESLGCYSDTYQRALPELLLNERDVTSKKFNDRLIDWQNFKKYLKGFACRCAKAAAAKGYTVIGLQFYGECWSGPEGEHSYNKYGPGHCINGEFEKSDKSDCEFKVGTQWTNHVYRIATPGCNEHFEPIGCFNDDLVTPRPIPHYIMTERDYRHESWNGRLVDWEHWSTYSPGLICRCAAAAREHKHTYFAIQFWGECWSGNVEETHYKRNGVSKNCRNEHFKECPCNSYACVGKMAANYVYKLRDKNAKCE